MQHLVTIEGKHGIKATVLADSISAMGQRFITLEIEYPRLVLAELNTHKMLSKNSFSSRAVPFLKMVEQLNGRPVRFGANQAGMQDQGEDFDALVQGYDEDGPCFGDPANYHTAEEAWGLAKEEAVFRAEMFYKAGYHKQVYNRLLEPFQMMKTVISGTEWENFFWLREHEAADPTLAELARVMNEARNASTPVLLQPGEWHLPYVHCVRDVERLKDSKLHRTGDFADGTMEYWMDETYTQQLTLDEAIKISCARCAAVSYRNEGYGLEKSLEVYDRLVGSDRKHASAFEHCTTPVREWGYYESEFTGTKVQYNHPWIPYTWEEGITHVDRKGKLWSGNLRGWRQYRKLIPGENYDGTE